MLLLTDGQFQKYQWYPEKDHANKVGYQEDTLKYNNHRFISHS